MCVRKSLIIYIHNHGNDCLPDFIKMKPRLDCTGDTPWLSSDHHNFLYIIISIEMCSLTPDDSLTAKKPVPPAMVHYAYGVPSTLSMRYLHRKQHDPLVTNLLACVIETVSKHILCYRHCVQRGMTPPPPPSKSTPIYP